MSNKQFFSITALLTFLVACNTGDAREETSGVISVAEAAAESPPVAELDDATIVAIFDAANTADIETGELAAKRGKSKAVRDFGSMLARDHKMVRQQGRDLAARLGVTPTTPIDNTTAVAHANAMARLRALRGEAFDRAFLEHEVAFHQGVIDAVGSTLLPAIQNAEIRDFVMKVAPAFEAHRAAAAHMRQKLGS